LHATALAVLGLIVDAGLARWHEAGDRRPARLGWPLGLRLGARFHVLDASAVAECRTLHKGGVRTNAPRRPPGSHHTTIAIDEQYYEKWGGVSRGGEPARGASR